MAKKYFYNSPRGFGNEFDIITVDNHNLMEVEAMDRFYRAYLRSDNINWDLHQITAARAKEIIMGERRTARMYRKAHLDDIVGATDFITATEFFNL